MDVLITLLLLLITTHLLYVKLNKAKLKVVKKKHPVGSSNFEAYRVFYSTKTLAIFTLLTSAFVAGLLVDLYKDGQPQGSVWASLLVLSSFIIPLGLFIWWSAKKNKKK